MRSRSRLDFRDLSNESPTRILLVCAWTCLTLSTLVYFGSLLAVIYIASYGYSVKWNFVVYVVNSGVLYLLNVISNGLLISSKSPVLHQNGVPTRSSATRNRDDESLDIQLSRMAGAEGFCHQEVQTNAMKITPPPSYEDLSDGTSEDVQTSISEVRPQVLSSADIIELFNKILLAINNSRAIDSEQPPQRPQEVPESGTLGGSTSNGSEQATSESSIYPQLPPEVLEHLSDPNAFIRALSIHKSKNRLKQSFENRKKVLEENRKYLEKQAGLPRQNFQGLPNENFENSHLDISSSTNSMSSRTELLQSTPRNSKKPSTSLIVQQNSSARNRQLSEQGNHDRPVVAFRNLGLPNPMRNFNSVDNLSSSVQSRGSPRSQSNFSLPTQDSSTLLRRKDVSQQDRICPTDPPHCTPSNPIGGSMKGLGSTISRCSQQNLTPQCHGVSNQDRSSTSSKDSQQNLASECPRVPKQDLSLTSSRDSQQNLTSQYQRISKQDFGSTSSSDSQQNLTQKDPRVSKQSLSSTSSRDSQLDLSSISPTISHDIGSANSIGIPLIEYPSNRPEYISLSAKSEEYSSLDQLEHEQVRSNLNDPLRKPRSIHALHQHQCSPSRIGQQVTTNSTSDSSLLEVKAVHKFSTEPDIRDNMKPAEWIAAWNRGLNKISHKLDSTLIGARL